MGRFAGSIASHASRSASEKRYSAGGLYDAAWPGRGSFGGAIGGGAFFRGS